VKIVYWRELLLLRFRYQTISQYVPKATRNIIILHPQSASSRVVKRKPLPTAHDCSSSQLRNTAHVRSRCRDNTRRGFQEIGPTPNIIAITTNILRLRVRNTFTHIIVVVKKYNIILYLRPTTTAYCRPSHRLRNRFFTRAVTRPRSPM